MQARRIIEVKDGQVRKLFVRTYEEQTVDADGNTVITEYTEYSVRTGQIEVVETIWDDTVTETYSDNSTKTKTVRRVTVEDIIASPKKTTLIEQTDTIVTNDVDTNDNIQEENAEEFSGYVSVDYNDTNLGTPTANVLTPDEYRSKQEFWATDSTSDDHLAEIKVDAAWSRGWTGKGSIIGIADTGADVNHQEIDSKIIGAKNFLDGTTNVSDLEGHGTHVAGIAAGEMNDKGSIGVAPDAELLIAKVTNNTGYSFFYAKRGLVWAHQNGAVVYNMSASSNFDSGWKNNLVKHNDGMFSNNHWYYGTNGYNGYVDDTKNWAVADNNQTVLTVAAGNDGLGYAAYPGLMATVTDKNGDLVLDGRMLIVGNWNTANQRIDPSSNKAGHVCLDWNEAVQQCDDAYRIKDFYIMAPGSSIYSSVRNNNYNHISGTSMAAPVVAGAVAVLHQMWPHMTAPNLAKLLLTTANKNIPNYDENVHGQGLLDMDAATQPAGVTGIPKTGRTDGAVAQLSGGVSGNINIGNIASSTMVLDEFERDFYVDLSGANFITDTRTSSWTKDLTQGKITSSFASLAGSVQRALGVVVSGQDQNSFGIAKQLNNWEVGMVQEKDRMLGNEFSGVFALDKYSRTVYGAYTASKTVFGLDFIGKTELGYTTNSADADGSLVTGVNNLTSLSAHAGVFKEVGNYTFGATAGIPTRIVHGELEMNVPVARTLDGKVISQNQTADLSSGYTEVDFGVSLNYNTQNHNLGAYVENRVNYAGTQQDVVEYGVEYEFKF